MDSAIAKKILFEIGQIDKHISTSSPLFDLREVEEPDYIEKCGTAMVLHSFYNGIENILLLIIKNKDSAVPSGDVWHRELLDAAFEKTENRTRIFREDLRTPLAGYLQLRHFVRHAYSFNFKWEKMSGALFGMIAVWESVKEDVKAFIENN